MKNKKGAIKLPFLYTELIQHLFISFLRHKFYVKKFNQLVAVATVALLQACTSTQNLDAAIGNIVIAEPQAVNYKSEIAIARYTEVIQRAELTDVQKAELYYDRGVIYDNVGLRNLARHDFTRALRLKPDLVDAYNFLGIYFTQMQEFDQAYEQFDSVIDLAPEHEYAYLNRGIALYYGGRPELAAEDLTVFFNKQANDPYRVLWLYLAEREANPELALANLKERAELVDNRIWAKQIIQLYLGEISQEKFMAQLTTNVSSNKALTDRLCEAYFYLGKLAQDKAQSQAAMNFFKLALTTNVYEFVEHRYAKLELELLRQTGKSAL